jgi:hypothetical protein
LFYDTGATYSTVCASGTTNGIYPIILSAAQKLAAANTPTTAIGTGFTYSAAGAANSSVCHDVAGSWAAITSLKNPTTASAGWCVDSTGASKEATALAANATVCP